MKAFNYHVVGIGFYIIFYLGAAQFRHDVIYTAPLGINQHTSQLLESVVKI